MTIGERIRKKRIEKGYTLEKLAFLLNTSKQTIQRYETGEIINIPLKKITAISTALNTSPTYLMGWLDDKDNSNTEIKDILKQRRLELSLTMLDVAKAVGVSEATVSRWEAGNISNMKSHRIVALAKVLQINPVALICPQKEKSGFPTPTITNKTSALLKAIEKLTDEQIDLLIAVADNISSSTTVSKENTQ